MFLKIKKIFENENITRVGIINIADCEIINQRILPSEAKSAIIFCIPYRSTTDCATDGFSEYSRVYDYHNYCKELYNRIYLTLSKETDYTFFGFCDHSPINEKLAAAKCGLGLIGRNSLFFDDIYGSYVFLGSLLTNFEWDEKSFEIKTCNNCGNCIKACPNSAITNNGIDRFKCLSGISQKKSKTNEEKQILKKHNIVWGCDICQVVCPYNKKALISPIAYFKETRIKHITKEMLLTISDEEFKKYAFSYKGRQIVLNNIDYI